MNRHEIRTIPVANRENARLRAGRQMFALLERRTLDDIRERAVDDSPAAVEARKAVWRAEHQLLVPDTGLYDTPQDFASPSNKVG